tara:strand:+ start:247 stop:594 length:348 start_codon:yes stop_codon:yes gene_type:complete
MLLRLFSGLVVFGIFTASPASAQPTLIQYTCNIEGLPAALTASVEVLDGVITYQGELKSQTAHYTFLGENEYADFTNMNKPERFRVHMLIQGVYLQLTVNPFGPQQTQYMCQQAQ